MNIRIRYAAVAALLIAAGAWLPLTPTAAANTGDIAVISTSVTGEFPDGIRFELRAQSSEGIEEIAVRLRIGQRTFGEYEYMDLEPTSSNGRTDASLLFRTDTAARYIPPGTIVKYFFEIMDEDGNRLDTEQQEFVYQDGRFEWDQVSDGIITVWYHGPVQSRAESILDAIQETLGIMGPLLGAGVDEPISVTMYNNWTEMRPALPPSSATLRRELVTEGQAHSEDGVLLVLGGAQRARGVAAHEVTHILVFRAGEGVLGSVPSWLNEGLAEYGNIDPGESYTYALRYAIATDSLLPITAMTSQPGDPQDVIIFYGQARSIVRFMVDEYGEEKMRELMATLKGGMNIRNAVQEVYGVNLIELENLWRDELGVSHRQAPSDASALPTAAPAPAVPLMSIDALRSGGAQPTAAPEQAAPPTAAPATPMPPAATPTPAPTPTTAPVSKAAAQAQTQPTAAAPAARNSGAATEPETPAPSGGGCNAPTGGQGGIAEMSSAALLIAAAALWLRRRVKP